MEKKKGLLVVFMRAEAGREDEFNTWYDSHLDLICEPEGIVGVSRYKLSETQLPGQTPDNHYATIYELEDPEAAVARMLAHKRESTDAGDLSDMKAYVLDHMITYRKP